MSACFHHSPVHQAWHDIESFYWVLIFMIIRHSQGLSLNLPGQNGLLDLNDSNQRVDALGYIFPDIGIAQSNILLELSTKKMMLLLEGRFTATPPQMIDNRFKAIDILSRKINRALTQGFEDFYFLVDQLHRLSCKIKASADDLPSMHSTALPIVYSVESKEDLIQWSKMLADDSLQAVNSQHKKARKLLNKVSKLKDVPRHDWILDILEKCINIQHLDQTPGAKEYSFPKEIIKGRVQPLSKSEPRNPFSPSRQLNLIPRSQSSGISQLRNGP
jgi:hypothetical protein